MAAFSTPKNKFLGSHSIVPDKPILSLRPTLLVVGYQGAGKSTLVNHVTGSHLKTQKAGEAVTQKIALRSSSSGAHPFDIYDTPGLGSTEEEEVRNSLAVRHALTDQPITAILIVVKIERTSITAKACLELSDCIPADAKDKIIICSTHWDEIDIQEAPAIFAGLRDSLLRKSFRSIMAIGKHTPAEEVANMIYALSARLPTSQISISDADCAFLFKLGSHIRNSIIISKEAMAEMDKIAKNFSDETIRLMNFIKAIPEEDRDEILYACHLYHKKRAEDLAENYSRSPGVRHLSQSNNFFAYNELKLRTKRAVEQFRDFVQNRLGWNMTDTSDPRNQIRKCPFCQQIWWKVEGCDGQTTCGSRAWTAMSTDIRNKPFVRIEIFDNGVEFRYQKNEAPPLTRPTTSRGTTEKGTGCGQKFIWKECQIVPQKDIEQLLGMAISDFIAANPPKQIALENLIKHYDSKSDLYENAYDRQKSELSKPSPSFFDTFMDLFR